MARKPVVELAGGLSPRQRVWALIRQQTGAFTCADVQPGDVPKATVLDYLKGLVVAGYLEIPPSPPFAKGGVYRMTRDNGIEAPRVRRDGSEVTQGNGNEAIWGAICVLDSFNAQTIADLSGAGLGTVKNYCSHLARAGFLTVVSKGRGGRAASVYRAVKSRISGPRAPMITRLKVVYDPNLHQIVWSEGADDAAKELDHGD